MDFLILQAEKNTGLPKGSARWVPTKDPMSTSVLLLLLLLLGCIALVAQQPIVIKHSRERSVGLSVCPAASALWKNSGTDPDAVWHRRSDGSRDEAGGGVWRSVLGNGYFWGANSRRAIVHRDL